MFTNVTQAGNIKAASREQRTRNDVNNSAITGAEWLLANNDKCGNITQGTVGIIGNSGAARCQQLMNVGENFASSQRQTTFRGGRGRRDAAHLPMALTCLLPLTFRRRDASYFCNQNAIWSCSETNVCRSADSFNNTDYPPPHLDLHSMQIILNILKTFRKQLPFFFSPVLGSFPSSCSHFYIIHRAFLFPPTLLILHLRFGAVNSQFIYSSNCRRKLAAVRCDGVWCIMEMLLLWEKCLFKSEPTCNLTLFWNSPKVKGWTPLVVFNCQNPKQVEGSNVNTVLSGKWRLINVSISEGTKPPPVTLK